MVGRDLLDCSYISCLLFLSRALCQDPRDGLRVSPDHFVPLQNVATLNTSPFSIFYSLLIWLLFFYTPFFFCCSFLFLAHCVALDLAGPELIHICLPLLNGVLKRHAPLLFAEFALLGWLLKRKGSPPNPPLLLFTSTCWSRTELKLSDFDLQSQESLALGKFLLSQSTTDFAFLFAFGFF